ncbi:MAG: hypothetical protein HY706_08815 [Candidatus Hydrogenedentes bacterium]|nr:hypothetical protein [Candidatus Hydrogenedentota bacterium]
MRRLRIADCGLRIDLNSGQGSPVTGRWLLTTDHWSLTTICLLLLFALPALSATLSGRVVDSTGSPVVDARVFIEAGLAAELQESKAGAEASFRFSEVAPGMVGVFAISDGKSFGGLSVTVAPDQDAANLEIKLGAPDVIRGKVSDFRGRAVAEAHVTRVALLGEAKVAIPFSKLAAFGFDEPVTDDRGAFTVNRLPAGSKVALKINHTNFAQEGISDINVGDQDVRVTLQTGVLVRGEVFSRDKQLPVVNAGIVIKNAQPPNDSLATRTDPSGKFLIRLKPGIYLCQAASAEFRSAGWEQLTITGEHPEQQVMLGVAGMGKIRGKVSDAESGEPIAGAKFVLSSQGNTAAIVRTDLSGGFDVIATEGENILTLESAPGYVPPERSAMRVQVVEGKEIELPTFWLAKLAAYQVQVLDNSLQPVSDAVVTVLRPTQFGWYRTDENGRAQLTFGALPSEGEVVGLAEHLREPVGAIFSFQPRDTREAKVQLLPLSNVTGRVVTAEQKPAKGIVVASALTAGIASSEPTWLWRTVTRGDGAFTWDSVVPQVPQRCLAYAGEAISAESATFNAAPSTSQDLGKLILASAGEGVSMYGQSLKWYENRLLSGSLPDKKNLKAKPALVIYCKPEEAPMVVAGLKTVGRAVGETRLICVVVVDGQYSTSGSPILVLEGPSPAAATTYLVDTGGKVTFECLGMPPLRALQGLPKSP